MNKKKRIFMIVLVIIVVCVALYFLREFLIFSDGKLDCSNPLNKEQVMELLNKGTSYSNYYYNPSSSKDTLNTEYYIKDNIVVCLINSKLVSWTDYNKGKQISIWDAEDLKLISIKNSNIEMKEDSQYGYDYSVITRAEEYKYLGKKQVNNRTMIIVQLKTGAHITKILIDEETGLIFGRIEFYKYGIFTFKENNDRKVKLNIVTEENIKIPDFESPEWKDYQIKEC